jgi:hypothetical protein
LLAYRGITCELHAIMTGVVQFQSLYTARIERGADSPDSSSPAGQKALEQMLLSWATWRYRHATTTSRCCAGPLTASSTTSST